jgi:hypothetical protein
MPYCNNWTERVMLNRTAAMICDRAPVSSCYADYVSADADLNATTSPVSVKSVLQHSIRPLAVRHGV